MTIANPPRLRTERTLPQSLREALRELPHARPKAAQLDELRHKLGLATLALDDGPARPALVPERRLRERRLRRTVVALVFFPIAATAAVGAVLDLEQRSARSAATAAGSAAPLQQSRPQRPPDRALAPSAIAPTAAPENSTSSAAPDSAANPVRPARAASTALASGHVEPAPRITETERTRASELELLQRANAALKGDPALAQALTAEHRQRFPAGNLSQEREAIAIKALVALGNLARARDSLARFEQTYPGSAHALELRQIVR